MEAAVSVHRRSNFLIGPEEEEREKKKQQVREAEAPN